MATQPNRSETLIWRKSRLSGESGGCVEVANSKLSVLVRDTREPSGVILEFSPAQWRSFVRRVKNEDAVSG
jgi:hypothetical protein